MASVQPPRYPSLFELEKIAISIDAILRLNSVFPFLRYRFLIDIIKGESFGYTVLIRPDEFMSEAAYVRNQQKLLFLRASIHSLGLKGGPHALMVLLHEFVHIYLNNPGIRRKIPRLDIRTLPDVGERLDEYIANRVAGAVAMPFKEAVIRKCKSSKDLVREFHVTDDAADQRIVQIRAMEGLQPIDIPPKETKPAPTPRFWQMLQDYEVATNSTLKTMDKVRSTPGVKGRLLKPCACGASTCTNDGKYLRCDNCDAALDPANVII